MSGATTPVSRTDATAASGLRFRETMTGFFALGEEDPVAGARRGREAGTTLSMHARVRIDDVAAFVAAADHRGHIEGAVDFAPIGGGRPLPSDRGVFQVFVADAPRHAPDLKRMVYELALEHDGQPLYVAGEKLVRGRSVFELWGDTTTLYTRLHEGHDRSGRVLGAGVLKLGVRGIVRLLPTLQGAGRGARGRAEALLRYGAFFARELADSYVRPRRRAGREG